MINLVCTRLSQQGTGDHHLLGRWYSDHIHLLQACLELEQARLFRCITPSIGHAPDYVCIYEFADWPAFRSFENSPAKLQATELTQAATGRHEIEIVQRMQYERVLARRYAQAALGAQTQWLFCCNMQMANRDASCRWLNDAFYELLNHLSGSSVQAYLRPAGAAEKNLILHLSLPNDLTEKNSSQLLDQITRLHSHQSLYGSRPVSLQIDWAAQLQPLYTSFI